MRLIHAELLKIRTAPRTTFGLVLALLAIVGLGAAGTSYDVANGFFEDPETEIVGIGHTATIFALILGILVITWDYRHGTIIQTLLAAPRRERVVGAKLLVAGVLAAALAVLALALAILIAEIWLGDDFELRGENWSQMFRLVVATVLWAVLGLGLGATLRTQVGALITALVWFLVVESILTSIGWKIGEIAQYLPGEVLGDFAGTGRPEEFSRATAGLLAFVYAFGLAAVGTLFVLRRDVA